MGPSVPLCSLPSVFGRQNGRPGVHQLLIRRYAVVSAVEFMTQETLFPQVLSARLSMTFPVPSHRASNPRNRPQCMPSTCQGPTRCAAVYSSNSPSLYTYPWTMRAWSNSLRSRVAVGYDASRARSASRVRRAHTHWRSATNAGQIALGTHRVQTG